MFKVSKATYYGCIKEYLEDKGEDSNESILYELLANNAGSIIDLRESLGGY